jgi:predicted MFS family arabinose efflux permease
MGYAVGAVLAGVLADAFGMRPAIGVVGVLTVVSGLVVAARMPETNVSARTEGEGTAAGAELTAQTGPH